MVIRYVCWGCDVGRQVLIRCSVRSGGGVVVDVVDVVDWLMSLIDLSVFVSCVCFFWLSMVVIL